MCQLKMFLTCDQCGFTGCYDKDELLKCRSTTAMVGMKKLEIPEVYLPTADQLGIFQHLLQNKFTIEIVNSKVVKMDKIDH